MMPLVTVVLTVYKRTDYLREALESVLAQTFTSREIIVVDDSGEAAAKPICEPYTRTGEIRYRANERNRGIVTSIRETVAQAQGKYISIINDDDAWEPEFLARVIPPMEADPARVLAFSDHWIMNEHSEVQLAETDANTKLYRRNEFPEGDIPDPASLVLLHNGVPLAMASAFRKDAIDWSEVADEVVGAYDFWIACLLATSGGRFYYAADRLTRYRVHSSMETGRRSIDKSDNMVYIYQQLLEANRFPEHTALLRERLASAYFQAGKERLYFNQHAAARTFFRQANTIHHAPKNCVAQLMSRLPHAVVKKLWLK